MTLSKALGLAGVVLAASTMTAGADRLELVDCVGAVVTMQERDASTSQEQAKSMVEWHQNVCDVVEKLPIATYRQATAVDVELPQYGMKTTLHVFPHSDADD